MHIILERKSTLTGKTNMTLLKGYTMHLFPVSQDILVS